MLESQKPGVALRSLCYKMMVNYNTTVWSAEDHTVLCEQQKASLNWLKPIDGITSLQSF